MADDPSRQAQADETGTAILRPKKSSVNFISDRFAALLTLRCSVRSPNRLVVDESASDDNSVASINPTTMETLSLFRGDTIILRGKKRKDTGTPSYTLYVVSYANPTPRAVLIVLSSEDVDEGKIQINKGQSLFSVPTLVTLSPSYRIDSIERIANIYEILT